jgi:hypothetical protein
MTTKLRRFFLGLALLGLAGGPAGAARAGGAFCAALRGDEATSRQAVEALRGEGPAAVARLLTTAPAEGSPGRDRWERVLDAVCAQRDCAASGLYWYTDFDLARAEAQRTGKPILSLRLLGRLDEEISCANSRFFRTVLYPDPEVSRALRDRFVLHWASVRPVPRLTVDFGDGRTLQGTITGNSIHYVLDPGGRVVDALPGLYGPGLFLARLQAAETAARELASVDQIYFGRARADYHLERLAAIGGFVAGEAGVDLRAIPAGASGVPTAIEAAELAMTKSMIEMPVVRAVSLGTRTAQLSGVDWAALAARHRGDWTLSDASRRFLVAKHGAVDPAEARRVVERFEELVGQDTMRNEYLLHSVLHTWLAAPETWQTGVDELNERVYADLFLTPGSDPWLGLKSPETYLALAASGGG